MVHMHLTLAHSKGQSKVKVTHIWTVNISYTVTDRANITTVNTYEVSHWLSNGLLHLTMTHYKGQNQGHANFYCEYLVKSDR